MIFNLMNMTCINFSFLNFLVVSTLVERSNPSICISFHWDQEYYGYTPVDVLTKCGL